MAIKPHVSMSAKNRIKEEGLRRNAYDVLPLHERGGGR